MSRKAFALFALLALPAGAAHGGPAARAAVIEGTVEVWVEDAPAASREHRLLRDAQGERFVLQGADAVPAGARVRVRGERSGSDGLVAACCDGAAIEMLAAPPPTPVAGEQRTLVLLANFADAPELEPLSPDEARTLVFGEVGDFVRESSYGQAWLSGDVHGWFTLPLSSSECSLSSAGDAADEAARAAGVDVSAYARIVYLFTDTACNVAGMASVGGTPSRAYLDGVFDARTIAHELGHGFGLLHSHALDCGASGLGESCTSIEYGDSLDTMGNPAFGHFDAAQKRRLGWLAAGGTPPITGVTGDGTYPISSFESGAAGAKALQIPRGIDPVTGALVSYWVEYRQPLGFDAFLAERSFRLGRGDVAHGVVVHLASDADPNSSQLLHLNADSWYYRTYGWLDWFDPALPVGASFTDAAAGITIRAVAADGAEAQVEVRFEAPLPDDPGPEPAPNQPPIARDDAATTAPGAAVPIDVLANDSDPDGDALVVRSVTQGSQGSVTVDAAGSVTYQPGPKARGSDSFVYEISDGIDVAQATVTIQLVKGGTGKGGKSSR